LFISSGFLKGLSLSMNSWLAGDADKLKYMPNILLRGPKEIPIIIEA